MLDVANIQTQIFASIRALRYSLQLYSMLHLKKINVLFQICCTVESGQEREVSFSSDPHAGDIHFYLKQNFALKVFLQV